MKNSKSVNELLSAVNEFLRDSNPDRQIDNGIHKVLCNLADAVSQQQEVIDSLREQSKVTIYGGHAGNIYCRIEAFEGIRSIGE